MLFDTLNGYIDRGKKYFIIDLKKVEYISSSGIGLLISVSQIVRKSNGKLKLVQINDNVYSTLRITHLILEFETYDTIKEAINSFSE